jgi:hypothetical protein
MPAVNVRDFGAKGNGTTDDTKPIQAANDAVATEGGGTVFFPAGTYRAIGVQQSSCVGFEASSGDATLIHPDGTSPASVVEGRIIRTTGSIERNSNTLSIAEAKRIRPGALLAIQAAGGPSGLQRTELDSATLPSVHTIAVRSIAGFLPWTNYLFVGDEIISYSGIMGNNLLDVQRGLFGTTASMHQAGTTVAQAQRLYAEVTSVSLDEVSIDRPAASSVSGAAVDVGSVGMWVHGLTIDGNRRPGGSPSKPFPLNYGLSRWVKIFGCTLEHGVHGGLLFDIGTSDSVVEDTKFADNGDPEHNLGAGLWLYRGASRNVVRRNTFVGREFIGVMIDDRTTHSTEFDAGSNHNTVDNNSLVVPPSDTGQPSTGILIESSSGNQVINNDIRESQIGVGIAETSQSPIPDDARSNSVRDNTLSLHELALWVTGSDNEFVDNVFRSVKHSVEDSGTRNRFDHNETQS